MWYVLDGKKTIPCSDLKKVEELLSSEENKRVGLDILDKYEVSTVFLALDHNYGGKDQPLLFETGVFQKGDYSEMLECLRASTWDAAEENHKQLLQKYRNL